MKREEFEEKYRNASETVDLWKLHREEIRVLDPNPIDKGTGTRNLIIVMEELAELQQQISKYLRGKDDRLGLIEEVADVIMGIDYIKHICGISDSEINKAINVKLDRLEETEKIYE